MNNFTKAKQQFDEGPGKASVLSNGFVPVDGKIVSNIAIRNARGEPLEEFYKWQFIYALIYSGFFTKDYIGTEVRFPKGNKNAAPLRMDAAIFDDAGWITHYSDYWAHRRTEDLEWLNAHLLAVVEFKRGDKEIERVFSGQVKAAMREKDPATSYVLGIYYDTERLYLFHRRDGLFLRYDEQKNQKGNDSKVGDLSLHLPDPYAFIPSFDQLKHRVHRPTMFDRASRSITDLDVITSITTVQTQTALSEVLRALSAVGMFNQRGYQIIIETLALKIFDEKRNEKNPAKKLEFYISNEEAHFASLTEKPIQQFISRMKSILAEAEQQYQKILRGKAIDWKDTNHVRAVVAVCQAFHDYSFVHSASSDLYQLVFYNFADEFTRGESAQFLTPLPVIEFLVKIVNPRDGETLIDPCCGIGDFLSLSFVHAQGKDAPWRLDDANIYGVDLDENMIMLATLNMLLNGDGEAKLFHKHDLGSILSKVAVGTPSQLVDLVPEYNVRGRWDERPDNAQLHKFNVVLTNPPFGEDRAFRPRNAHEREVIETYETWHLARNTIEAEDATEARAAGRQGNKRAAKSAEAIDRGVVFLENAYRSLKDEGRLGIVLSNSIASINRWQRVREWLMARMRIVALFDLPPNVFAETGVNTTIIVAYKPELEQLTRLNETEYSVFVRDIQKVGYEKRTSKRNVIFNKTYRIDDATFEVETDADGNPVLDEDFTQTIADFRQWSLGQEETLQKIFLREA